LEKVLLSQGKPILAQACFLSQKFHKDIIHVSLRRTYIIDVIYMLQWYIMLYTKDGPPEEEPGLVAAKTCCVFIRISPVTTISNQEDQRDRSKYTSWSIPSQRSHQISPITET